MQQCAHVVYCIISIMSIRGVLGGYSNTNMLKCSLPKTPPKQPTKVRNSGGLLCLNTKQWNTRQCSETIVAQMFDQPCAPFQILRYLKSTTTFGPMTISKACASFGSSRPSLPTFSVLRLATTNGLCHLYECNIGHSSTCVLHTHVCQQCVHFLCSTEAIFP